MGLGSEVNRWKSLASRPTLGFTDDIDLKVPQRNRIYNQSINHYTTHTSTHHFNTRRKTQNPHKPLSKWTQRPKSCSKCASKPPSQTLALLSRYAIPSLTTILHNHHPISPPLPSVPSNFPDHDLTFSFRQKLNEHCFDRCIPTPGSSLSSGESTCYTNCMEKYMAAWNTTSRQYLTHVQKGAGSGI